MKKPLHAHQVTRKGGGHAENALHHWPTDAIVFELVQGGVRELFDGLMESANADDDPLAHDMIYRLWRYGLTEQYMRGMAFDVKNGIRFGSYPELDEDKDRFIWRRSLAINQTIDRGAAYAAVLLYAVNAGLLRHELKRCDGSRIVDGGKQKCDRFYAGADNKKFCSPRCSIRERVRDKRDRDRKHAEEQERKHRRSQLRRAK